MKRLIFLQIVLILTVPRIDSFAQQTNFQITSPPIPWYEFSKGQKDLKVNGTFLYLTGEIEDPNAGGDVEVYGGGLSGFYRYAFKDQFAFDIGGLVLGAGGDVGSRASMSMAIFSVPFDIEFQPVKTDRFAVILFGGFNFTWLYLGVVIDDGTTVDLWSSMRGPQGGLQVAVKTSDFVFTPFFMVTSLSGDAEIDITNSSGKTMSVTSGIPASTSLFYGIDLVYVPWDITLSSIIQQAMSSGDNQGYKTYVVMLSYHFQIEEGENSIVIPPDENKAKVKPKKKQESINKQKQ